MTDNQFQAKNDSAFERAELQLFSLKIPSWLNAISVFYEFPTQLYFYFPQIARPKL